MSLPLPPFFDPAAASRVYRVRLPGAGGRGPGVGGDARDRARRRRIHGGWLSS